MRRFFDYVIRPIERSVQRSMTSWTRTTPNRTENRVQFKVQGNSLNWTEVQSRVQQNILRTESNRVWPSLQQISTCSTWSACHYPLQLILKPMISLLHNARISMISDEVHLLWPSTAHSEGHSLPVVNSPWSPHLILCKKGSQEKVIRLFADFSLTEIRLFWLQKSCKSQGKKSGKTH